MKKKAVLVAKFKEGPDIEFSEKFQMIKKTVNSLIQTKTRIVYCDGTLTTYEMISKTAYSLSLRPITYNIDKTPKHKAFNILAGVRYRVSHGY